jgi:toxin ParE1/3/4
LLDKIKAAATRLLDFPMAGPSREQLASGLRVIFHGNYALYYTFNETEVIIGLKNNGERRT